jgi:hypothetical protein
LTIRFWAPEIASMLNPEVNRRREEGFYQQLLLEIPLPPPPPPREVEEDLDRGIVVLDIC